MSNNICECPRECQKVAVCKAHFSKGAQNNSHEALAAQERGLEKNLFQI